MRQYRRKTFLIVGFLLLLGAILAKPSSNAQVLNPELQNKKIIAIEFEGLRNTNPGDVRSTLSDYDIKVGKAYSDKKLNQAFKALFSQKRSTLYYGDVEAKEQGGGVQLILSFKERNRIRDIIFQGLDEIVESQLRDTLPIQEGDILRDFLLYRSKEIILAKYREEGMFLASIQVQKRYDEQNNTVDVIFKVDEGEEILIEKITIKGLKNFDEDDVISVMELNEDSFFSSGTFKKETYAQDRQRILQYIRKDGYRYAKITSTMEEEIQYIWQDQKKEKRAIRLEIHVQEGKKYFFDKYKVTIENEKGKDGKEKDTVYKEDFLKETLKQSERGAVFDGQSYQEDRQNLSMLYASRGYIFARIIPEESLNQEEKLIDGQLYPAKSLISVHFKIKEGPKAEIENIIIKGNKKTKDKVIRRELLVKEGEVFNSFKVRRSQQRLHNLGFFKEVKLDARPGSREPKMNLIVEVQEQPTGTISLGGGYGTQSGFSIFTEVAENNLMGNGQRLSGRFEYGPQRKQIKASFRDPWIIDDYPVSFFASAYYLLRTYPVSPIVAGTDIEAEYDKSIIGASIGLGYRFWIFYGANISFGTQRSTAIQATGAASDPIFQQIDLGPQYSNSVRLSLYRDTRDNVFNTVNGLKTSLSYEIVGWGGDDHYQRVNPVTEYYFSPFHLPFLPTHPTVLMLRISGDFTAPPLWDKDSQRPDNALIELDDKLYVGGVETVRGWDMVDFNYSSLPKQKHWVDGGDHRILFSLEYRIPIEKRMLWFVSFIDGGGLWDAYDTSASTTSLGSNLSTDTVNADNFVYSWGFGLRVQIPVMPIRLYMAQRVVYKGKNPTGDYHGLYGFDTLDELHFVFGIGDVRY